MKIAVLLSGGVDSSVALKLVKDKGHDVTAFYLKVWMEDDFSFGDCPWEEDVEYVKNVCAQLGVPFDIIPMQREYFERVVEYALGELRSGRTPNPDMMCNRLIKFGAFYEKYGHEFDRIASGHYAKTVTDCGGHPHLLTNPDPVKDQTYFLSQMTIEQLKKATFPLGDLAKQHVRHLANEWELVNAARKDSQGICFLGKINYRQFLEKYVGEKKGRIIEKSTGTILGQHNGYWFYTIGQRSGLDLGGGPWFVVEKDSADNIIYVSHGYDPEDIYVDQFEIENMNWINHLPGLKNERVRFKIRHSPVFYDGVITEIGENKLRVEPDEKLAAVAQGQFGVIYQDGECFGGGVIC